MPNKKMRDPTIRIFVAVFNFTQTFPQTYIFHHIIIIGKIGLQN